MNVAFLGLGAMGSRMATNLVAAGFRVTVWNRDPSKTAPLVQRGASAADTPRDAARGADVVIAMVRDDGASRAVWLDANNGALGTLGNGAIAIEASTLTIEWVRELASAVRGRGASLLDAPVAGSRPQAETAQLIFMAGGEASALERATPVLRAMSSAVHHAGESGAGAAVKLAVNALFGVQVAALGEIAGVMRANNVDLAKAFEILGSTPVASPAAKGAMASMHAGQFAAQFPVELVEKDFGYVERAGVGVAAVPIARATRAVMQRAIDAGYGADNITSVVRLYASR
jgi:3-hydroxyisobutyrate dehydrogenase